MLSVFGFKDAEGLNEAYSNIREFLMYADPNVQLDIPNSVWYHKDFDVYDSFLQLVKHYYDAEIDKLDFRQEEAAKEVMNESEETRLNSSHVKISYAVFC